MKKRVAVDLSSKKRGGPYMSMTNLMNSSLKEKYEFIPFEYDASIGRGISWKRIKDLQKKIEKINPDILHFTGLTLQGFHLAVAGYLAKVKTRIVVIRGSSLEALSADFPIYKKIPMFFLEWITVFLSTACYGVSKYSSQITIPKLFPHKNKGYIYNFATIRYISNSKVKRSDFGFKPTDVIVTTVARIVLPKGYAHLTNAILANTNENLKFMIIGDGDYLPTMKEKLESLEKKGNVVFLGHRTDIGDLLHISDIFVLPTLHETLSVSLLEASNAGLPLVASRTGGVPEIVHDGENGYLTDVGNSDQILAAIQKLAGNKKLREKMGQCSLEYLHKNFDSEKLASQVTELYESLSPSYPTIK